MYEVAYCGAPPQPHELLASWNLDPWLLAALASAAILTLRVLEKDRQPLALGSLFVLLITFVSPLCALSSALFSARVVHHILLVAVSAPMLAIALPPLSRPWITVSFAVATITLWLWHVPAFYTFALQDTGLYWLMQLTLLGSAVWFWRAILASRHEMLAALFTIAAAIGQMGFLGALLTFAPNPLYPHHFLAPIAFGLSPLQDQQLAGLIMWVPAMVPYAVIAMGIARQAWRGEWTRGTA